MFVSKMSFTIHYPDTATPAAGADTATPAAGAAAAGGRRRRPLSLVGLVGRDGQVYWVESFAAKLFHTETLTIHHVNPPLPTVSDVVGFIPIHLHRLHNNNSTTQQPKRRCLSNRTHYFRNWLLKERVLTHDQLCQAFHNYTTTTTTTTAAAAAAATAVNDDDDVEDRARIHHFGELLNSRETHVLEETDSRHQCHLRIVNININNNNNRLENPPPRSPAELVAFFRDDIRSIPFFIWLAFFKLEIKKKLYQPSSSPPPPPSV